MVLPGRSLQEGSGVVGARIAGGVDGGLDGFQHVALVVVGEGVAPHGKDDAGADGAVDLTAVGEVFERAWRFVVRAEGFAPVHGHGEIKFAGAQEMDGIAAGDLLALERWNHRSDKVDPGEEFLQAGQLGVGHVIVLQEGPCGLSADGDDAVSDQLGDEEGFVFENAARRKGGFDIVDGGFEVSGVDVVKRGDGKPLGGFFGGGEMGQECVDAAIVEGITEDGAAQGLTQFVESFAIAFEVFGDLFPAEGDSHVFFKPLGLPGDDDGFAGGDAFEGRR
jgi:hypothetical protein